MYNFIIINILCKIMNKFQLFFICSHLLYLCFLNLKILKENLLKLQKILNVGVPHRRTKPCRMVLFWIEGRHPEDAEQRGIASWSGLCPKLWPQKHFYVYKLKQIFWPSRNYRSTLAEDEKQQSGTLMYRIVILNASIYVSSKA